MNILTQKTTDPILVIGATGNVGQAVVRSLHHCGSISRATTLNDQTAINLPREADETVIFDFAKPETFKDSFKYVKKMFLMRPPALSDANKYFKPVIDYAVEAGVEQIVFLSLIGVEEKSYVPHYKIEKLIEASPISYTFLRAGFFMQNLNTTHRADIVEHQDIFIPAGKAKTAFIDTRDIGAVAAHVLTTEGHENKAYELTGRQALSYDEVADIFTKVLGQKISYSQPSLLRFAWRMKRRGHPMPFVFVTTALYVATRCGSAEKITEDVHMLLGREPILFEQYVRDYADSWQTNNEGVNNGF